MSSADKTREVLMIVNMLLEDVATDPARLLRAQDIAKIDVAAALSSYTPVTDEMVNRFLAWPLPMSVSSDLCVTKRELESSYPPKRIGTNLLTADEARAMLEHVLNAPLPESEATSAELRRTLTGDSRFNDAPVSAIPPTQPDHDTAMLLAAISTASIQNTPESAKQRIGRDSPYWTQAYADVCVAVDREMALLASRSSTADIYALIEDSLHSHGHPFAAAHVAMLARSAITPVSK